MPVVVSTWLSIAVSVPEAILVSQRAVECSDGKGGAATHAGSHFGQVVLGDGKDDGDGLSLGDHHEAGGGVDLVCGGEYNHIAGVYQAQADAAGKRRGDMAPAELHLEKLKVALVALDLAFILQYQFLLVVELLFWDCVASPRCAVAFEIHLRLGQDIDIPQEGALGLQYLRLKGARIDIDQGIAFVNDLTFDVVNGGDESVHLSGDGRSVDGRDRTDRLQVDADAALLRNGCGNRHRTRSDQPRSLWPPENAFVMLHRRSTPRRRERAQSSTRALGVFFGMAAGIAAAALTAVRAPDPAFPPGFVDLLPQSLPSNWGSIRPLAGIRAAPGPRRVGNPYRVVLVFAPGTANLFPLDAASSDEA